MAAFYIFPVLRIDDDSVKIDPVGILGSEDDDVSKILVEKLEGMAKKVYERFKEPVKMVFDDDARASYDRAAVCYVCKEGFVNNSETRRKVRDHCHFTGRYRGALHSECNLKLKQRPFVIPVFAHNMSGYDSHMFVKLLAETENGVECIPQNEGKCMSFSKHVLNNKNVYVKLEFKDTFRFLGKSLSYLALGPSLTLGTRVSVLPRSNKRYSEANNITRTSIWTVFLGLMRHHHHLRKRLTHR